jgi:[glutamine synthetase] adenylyltransferase / [glutamine synthetase]-adenylyl-L-tyrosine phosphorylase
MAKLTPKDLLLAPHLDDQQVASILRPYGFKEIEKADANLQAMSDDPRGRKLLSEIIQELLASFSESVDPDQALNYFERFSQAAINKINLFSYLRQSPHTLELLAKTFGGSPFMSEILIRDPVYLYWVADPRVLYKERNKKELAQDLSHALKHLRSEQKKLDILRIYKRKEILRIGIRDLLRLCGVEETLSSLSFLAEVLIQNAYKICESTALQAYGIPYYRNPSGRRIRNGFTILAMGKLGGSELNFSSDVDLMYLYTSDQGSTSKSRSGNRNTSIPNQEYFKQLSQKISSALSEMTNEGYVYRVDLRLRPEGKMGSIAHSLKAIRRYYSSQGETWERLALIKAWPVAGDISLGNKFLSTVRPFIYQRPFDLKALSEIKRVKERIDQKVSLRGQTNRHVKLGFGGIREIEFIVQSLQIAFGKKHPKIHERNTLASLRNLLKYRIFNNDIHRALSDAYVFLRDVENKLQMVYDFQIHAIPDSTEEIRACVLRLCYQDTHRKTATEQFLQDYQSHTTQVNRIFRSLFHASKGSRFLHRPVSNR